MYLVFICAGIFWLLLGDSRDFDERQQINRGKAMYAAIWVLFSYALPTMIGIIAYEHPILQNPLAVLLIGCTLVMLTYLTVAIILDAYVPLNFPGIVYLYLVFGAVAIAAFFFDHKYFDIMHEGVDWMCLALGIVFLWAGALMVIMKPIRTYLYSKAED